jgi:hypothetical protein
MRYKYLIRIIPLLFLVCAINISAFTIDDCSTNTSHYLLYEDFESGVLNTAWNQYGGASVQSNVKYEGNYALRCNGTGLANCLCAETTKVIGINTSILAYISADVQTSASFESIYTLVLGRDYGANFKIAEGGAVTGLWNYYDGAWKTLSVGHTKANTSWDRLYFYTKSETLMNINITNSSDYSIQTDYTPSNGLTQSFLANLSIGSNNILNNYAIYYDKIMIWNRTIYGDTCPPVISGFLNFTTPSESGTTKYLPNNYILVNVTQNNIASFTNMTIYLYNSTGLYTSITTTNSTQFMNFTVPMINETYYYNVTARNTTNQSMNSATYTNYILYNILNVTAKNYTGGTIQNFTIIMNSTTYSTNTSYVLLYVIQTQNYTINSNMSAYAYTSQTIYINNSYQNLALSLYPSNSINITAFSESTSTFLNQTFYLNFIGTTNQLNYTLLNGNAFILNIPSDTYTISFTNTNFSTRSYVVTINSTTSQTLNTYIGNGSSIGMYVYDYSNVPLTAVINIQKLIGTSYLTIAQATTDVTGYASLPLVDGTIYKITITATGFTTRTASFTPYYVNQPYTFKLESSTSTPFISPNAYVSYSISPNVTYLNHSNQTFSFQLSSPDGLLQYASILCKNTYDYADGSPNGLTVQVTVDLTSYSGVVRCQYVYLLDGFSLINMSRIYYVTSYDLTSQNHTVISGFEDFVAENDNEAWTIIVGMFILLTIVILMSQITQNSLVSTISVLVGTLIMGLLGMFPLNITLFVFVISIGWLYFSQRY